MAGEGTTYLEFGLGLATGMLRESLAAVRADPGDTVGAQSVHRSLPGHPTSR
ncbi:MAG: hypothetical protein JRG84_20125 [Deltaproteobacteria bacterium]|nr:hypothetical protein [Deltaproteobacteria bacterium]